MANLVSESSSGHIYNPPLWRLLLGVFVLPVAAAFWGWISWNLPDILSGRFDRWLDSASFLISFSLAAVFWSCLLIGFNRDWFAIIIDRDAISGPASLGGRKVIRRSELDRERTQRQNALDKLFRIRKVWDQKGNSIMINKLYFRDDQLEEMQKLIGWG